MKRRIIILGTVILLVVAAWTAGWFYVTSLVRQNIVALASATRNGRACMPGR